MTTNHDTGTITPDTTLREEISNLLIAYEKARGNHDYAVQIPEVERILDEFTNLITARQNAAYQEGLAKLGKTYTNLSEEIEQARRQVIEAFREAARDWEDNHTLSRGNRDYVDAVAEKLLGEQANTQQDEND